MVEMHGRWQIDDEYIISPLTSSHIIAPEVGTELLGQLVFPPPLFTSVSPLTSRRGSSPTIWRDGIT
jgi:hypothetical protein